MIFLDPHDSWDLTPRRIDVEFYARQEKNRHRPSSSARVCHCLLRVHDQAHLEILTTVLPQLTSALVGFSFLETVVFETGAECGDGIQPVLDALRPTVGAEVQHRTCDDAHKVALQVKKGTARVLEMGPLSPIWYNDWDMRWKSL